MFKFEESVIAYVVPEVVKLFQFKVSVLNVVAAATCRVDPVTVTVPAVRVNIPVSYLTVPDIVRVPAVLIVILFRNTPVEEFDQVPVPPNTIVVVPKYIPAVVCVKLPFILSVLFVRVVFPLP